MFSRIQKNLINYDDTQLVKRAVSDHQYFDEIYKRYFDGIYRFVARRVYDENKIQDIVSQTFLTAFYRLDTIDITKKVHLKAWLSRIAYYTMSNIFKEMSYLDVAQDIEIVDESYNISDIAEYRHTVDHFNKLTTAQAKIMYLKYVDGYTNKDIAEITGLQEKTISGVISKATDRLKNILLEKNK